MPYEFLSPLAKLLARISAIKEFCPGLLVERYLKFVKPGCHCALESERDHGPNCSLSRGLQVKTVIKVIPVDCVDETFDQIDRYRELQRLVNESHRST